MYIYGCNKGAKLLITSIPMVVGVYQIVHKLTNPFKSRLQGTVSFDGISKISIIAKNKMEQ